MATGQYMQFSGTTIYKYDAVKQESDVKAKRLGPQA